MKTTMEYLAITTQGESPVVWGRGATEDEAMADAERRFDRDGVGVRGALLVVTADELAQAMAK